MEGHLSTSDSVWSARDTSPPEIDDALRELLRERHAEDSETVPARVLNMVVVVDADWSGEIANRLRHVGRFQPSRTIVCQVERGRTRLDATASLASDGDVAPDAPEPLRELVVLRCGPQHVARLDRIVDPLVVTDLPTMVWSPHGYDEAVDALLPLGQVVLLDSVDGDDVAEALARAHHLSEQAYVVDLAWLRSTPWRERVAANFDPPALRPQLQTISAVTVRHNPASGAAALLLVGWLASRLGWEVSRLARVDGGLQGRARARRQEIAIRLVRDGAQAVRGLRSVELETADGRRLALARGDGGLRASYRGAKGGESEWTLMGASRGEAGILGEGIRQALLRDPTYGPALAAAEAMAA